MKRENIFAGLFFLVIALAFAFPIFRNFDHWGIQDWDQHFFYQAVARETFLEYRQFPLWNPYTCGGTTTRATVWPPSGTASSAATRPSMPPGSSPTRDGAISYFMDENGIYIGVLPFLLILSGLVIRGRRRPALLLCLLIFLWLSFGNRAPVSLWALVHKLPGFDSMRVAQRFRIVVLLSASLFAGFGLQAVREYLAGKIAREKTGRRGWLPGLEPELLPRLES